MAALRTPGELVEEQWLLQELGPGLGIKATSGPGGALGGRRVIIQYGGGGRSSPSKSCRISYFIISQFLCHMKLKDTYSLEEKL